MESNLGTAIRTNVVLVMSWMMVFVTGKGAKLREVPKGELGFICLSGLATGGSWLCYYKALQDGPASVVAPIDKLSILVTILFSYLVFHEKLTRVRPRAAFFVSFSWNTSHENRIVTRMLSLSMGATTLAGPSCRAL